MNLIKQEDVIQAVAAALQYISYVHPPDFIQALVTAYGHEKSPIARNAIGQILQNSKMCARAHRPICQDTGMVVIFAKVGMAVRWDTEHSLSSMIDQGVKLAYTNSENPLRASMVESAFGARVNTKDNSPAIVHTSLVPGDKLDLYIGAKGGGSENKARFSILNPAADIEQWVIDIVAELGAGWCPPGIIGLGLGGSAEKAMLMAKESLFAPIDMPQIITAGPKNVEEELRLRLYERINALGIGAQGLGGTNTVLDVKLKTFPTHAASLPIALIPNCAANRHIHLTLDGSGVPQLPPPDLALWPDIQQEVGFSRKINIDKLDKAELQQLTAGETVLLSGKILTGRDAAHKRIQDILARGETLAQHGLDFKDRVIYYVGPVAPVGAEVVGPAGPTTASRMDSYSQMMLGELSLAAMIGKAERGQDTMELIKQYGAVYFIAVGGAAYLVAQAIKEARVVAFADLGMEAIYEFTVKDMPLMVAVDSRGASIHEQGPRQWRSL